MKAIYFLYSFLAIEEQQQKAKHDAQVNYFKQLLNGQEPTLHKPNLLASLHQDSLHDELAQERHLSQMMARLLNESQGPSAAGAEFLADGR